MHGFPIGYWDNVEVPQLVLNLVFVLELSRLLANWLLSPFGIPDHQYGAPLDQPLTTWPITPLTNTVSVRYSGLIFSASISPSSPVSPVPPYRDQQSVRENLPTVFDYGSLRADRHEVVVCTVCFNDFVSRDRVRRLAKCGHVFHMECLDKWVEYENYICPLCRSPIF